MSKRSLGPLVLLLISSASSAACVAGRGDVADTTDDSIREDTSHAPLIVRVPVRFTQNDPGDVGMSFSSSWVPFTSVAQDKVDGYDWGYTDGSDADRMVTWFKPDQPGAGYATAYFRLEIPYDTTGAVAYGLTRVKLESEYMSTQYASTLVRRYSPLRVRSGSAQPCLSITMSGALDGKFKAVPVPFTDQGFTERDWNLGDTDGQGIPIKKVIVGTLRFAAYCWPEDVQGSTQGSGGIAAPPGAFIMVSKNDGQGQNEAASVFVNLLENEQGGVSIGDLFSTDATLLGDADRQAYDSAVNAFAPQFAADVQQGEQDALAAAEAAAAAGP